MLSLKPSSLTIGLRSKTLLQLTVLSGAFTVLRDRLILLRSFLHTFFILIYYLKI